MWGASRPVVGLDVNDWFRHEPTHIHRSRRIAKNLTSSFSPDFLEFMFHSWRPVTSLHKARAFARYPNIQCFFSHGGGAIAFLADRVSRWAKHGPMLPAGPMAYLRGLNPIQPALPIVLRTLFLGALVPWKQMLFGTGYPYVSAVV